MFKSTGRRDDIISLGYLLIYLLNNGKIPGINTYEILEYRNKFEYFRKVKSIDYNYLLCFGKGEDLKIFFKEVLSY
jgi:hypothetical protein